LGHLGIQLAAKMGFRTVAIGGGGDKDDLARKLGAEHYIDTGAEDPVAALQALGGARTILATVPSGKAVSPLIGSLGVRGKLVVVGALNQSKPELCHGRPEREHRWPCVWHLGREGWC
jgi:D-arabinose 1-dehydrogenase-like Zn-dependent alcohol dehydrogenase